MYEDGPSDRPDLVEREQSRRRKPTGSKGDRGRGQGG